MIIFLEATKLNSDEKISSFVQLHIREKPPSIIANGEKLKIPYLQCFGAARTAKRDENL